MAEGRAFGNDATLFRSSSGPAQAFEFDQLLAHGRFRIGTFAGVCNPGPMDSLIRLLVRFVLVPMGILAAVIAAIGVAAASNWGTFRTLVAAPVIDIAALF